MSRRARVRMSVWVPSSRPPRLKPVPSFRRVARSFVLRSFASSFAQQAGHYDVLSLAGGLVGIALACAAPATPLAWTLARCVQLLRTRHFKVAPHLRIIVKLINQIIQQ